MVWNCFEILKKQTNSDTAKNATIEWIDHDNCIYFGDIVV